MSSFSDFMQSVLRDRIYKRSEPVDWENRKEMIRRGDFELSFDSPRTEFSATLRELEQFQAAELRQIKEIMGDYE